MFKKILVCTDLSPAADAMIQCAGELRTIGTEEVILIHVIYVANTPGLEELLTQDARPVLERQKKQLEQQGMKVVVETPLGVPAHTINETAEKHDVSAILIGSQGKGILRAATLGSVSAKLLHIVRRPILLARITLLEGDKCQLACGTLFRKILFSTDFSETADHALSYVGKIAAETKCPVTIMHVVQEKAGITRTAKHLEDDHLVLLEADKNRLTALGATEVTIDLTYGIPFQEIIRKAQESNYSLIVMGSQGKGFLREIFLGSVANEVARHATVPILFVPHE